MERIDKINKDFSTLFHEGQDLLRAEAGKGMNACREEAFRDFEAAGGIPYKRENYLYANLLPVFERDYNVSLKYVQQDVHLADVFQCNVPCLDTSLVLTINGRYWRENALTELPEGVIVCGLAEASVKYPELFDRYYNQHTTPGRGDGLVALNTAFAQDGVFVYVPDRVVIERPLQIVNLMRAKADLMSFQRNLVIVGKEAQATLLVCDHTLSENYFLSNNLTEVVVGDNAMVDYYHVQNQHLGASQVNSVFVTQKRDSRFEANVISLYGGFIRNNLYAALTEEGCECNLYGMYLSDKKQEVDNFTFIDHIAPRCRSNEHFKGVLDDAALANFAGIITVRPDAQQTESYQANNNLLLTDMAQVNTKPQLIIDADDVKCSHGATVGQIDEEAMFYLRSRGISLAEARMMMMFGFAHEIVGKVRLEPLRTKIDDLVDKRLRGELTKCHNCVLHCKQ